MVVVLLQIQHCELFITLCTQYNLGLFSSNNLKKRLCPHYFCRNYVSILSTGTFYSTVLCYFCLHRFPVFFFPPFFYLSSSSLFCCSVFPIPLSSLFPLLSTTVFWCIFLFLLLSLFNPFLVPLSFSFLFLFPALFLILCYPHSSIFFFLLYFLTYSLSPFHPLSFLFPYFPFTVHCLQTISFSTSLLYGWL